MIFKENEDYTIKKELWHGTYVYFLLFEKDVVYIGKTNRGLKGIAKHIIEKDFDEVKIICCEYEKLDETKKYYINIYKPKYNNLKN